MSSEITYSLLNQLISELKEFSQAALLEGSCAWGNLEDCHDLDLEVVISRFSDLERVNRARGILKKFKVDIDLGLGFMAKEKSRKFDLLQVKTILKDVGFGIRFIKSKSFQRVCRLDLVRLNRSFFLLSLRPQVKKDQSTFYYQRNFAGERITVPKKFLVQDGKQITWVPAAILNQQRQYFPGSLVDRYIAGSKTLFDLEGTVQRELDKLKKNLAKRLLYERKRYLTSTRLGLDKMLCRYEKIPSKLKEKLKQETKTLLRDLEKKIYAK